MLHFLSIFLLTSIFNQDIQYPVSAIPTDLTKGANVVVRDEQMTVSVEKRNKMTITYHKAVTILTKAGEQHDPIHIWYNDSRKLKHVKAFVYDAKGKEVAKLSKKDFTDHSASGDGTFHGDSRVLFYDHTSPSLPYTVYYEYRIETSNTGFLPIWAPVVSTSCAVQKSSMAFSVPITSTFQNNPKNFDLYPNIEYEFSKQQASVSINNQRALKSEDLQQDFEERIPQLILSLDKFHLEGQDGIGSSWEELGSWYFNTLLSDVQELPQDAKVDIHKLTDHLSSDVEKARVVYKYVQDRSRYISIQLGIGGWKPFPATQVHKLGYGDCKGLTNYTHALLTEVGVKSHYTIVSSGSRKEDIAGYPSRLCGDHVILCLPQSSNQDTIWLECTSQTSPFGYLSDFTDDRKVLVVTPQGGLIGHTTKYLDDDNYTSTHANIQVSSNGNIEGEVDYSYGGVYFDQSRIQNYDKERQLETLTSRMSNIGKTDVKKYNFKSYEDQIKFVEHIELSSTGYAVEAGQDYIVPLHSFQKSEYVPDRERNRITDFIIRRGYIEMDTTLIQLPDEWMTSTLPEPIQIETEFGHYHTQVTMNEKKQLVVLRSFFLQHGVYDKSMYAAYRKFRKQIVKADKSKILFQIKSK